MAGRHVVRIQPPVPRQAIGLAVLLLLAGCGAKAGPAAVVPSYAPEAEFDDATGAIRGLVLTVEDQPIVSAGVLLIPGGLTVKTASDGSFTFSRLDPGPYTIMAQGLGYEHGTATAAVTAGEATDVQVVLKEVRILVPREEVLTYTGYFQCRMSTSLSSGPCGFLPLVGDAAGVAGLISPNDKNDFRFRLSGDDYTEIVFEARWTPSSVATNPKMNIIFSYTNRSSTHWFANTTPGLSPLKMVHEAGVQGPGGQFPGGHPRLPDSNLTLRAWMTLPFGTALSPVNVAYELRYEMWVTIFYNKEAPEDYTAIA